ncbi:MAG: response regulator [Burkholderiaceae bacterium]|nr:response regulator [Burkholderiaceae bacterium]
MHLTNSSILLVEDDDVDAMTVRRAFRELKVTNPLIQQVNGEAALEFLGSVAVHELPCLILLDLNMPVMNGIEFLQVVKQHARWRRIPAVVLTTSQEEQDKIASFDLSVAGYMTKPVDYRKFVDAMCTIDAYWTLSEVSPID